MVDQLVSAENSQQAGLGSELELGSCRPTQGPQHFGSAWELT